MTVGPVDVEIDDLLFDAENPRFDKAANQREALQRILGDQKDKLVALAKSIVNEGMNPMDRLLVLREKKGGDRFVALEGNRRLAALKILANSSVLTDLTVTPSIRRALDRLAEKFDRCNVEPLSCFEVDDRASGNTWVHLRHTGENEGSGVVSWSGIAASRFRGQDPALQALDFVKAHGKLTDEQRKALEDRFPITTLDRLLASREVRQRLGFDVKDRKLVSPLPPDEIMKPLRRMVLDLALGVKTVSDLKNQKQQIDYVESFDAGSKPDVSRKGDIRAIDEIGEGEFKVKPTSTPRKRTADPSDRRTLVPRSVHLHVADNRIASIFKELRLLKIDRTPNAIAVLFRVFLELSVDHHLDTNHLPLTFTDPKSGREIDKPLKKKVAAVVDDLVNNKGRNRKDYAGVLRALNVDHSPLHIDLLNGYVHNRFVTPKSRDLLGAWDDAQRFFEGIWS